MSRPQPQGLIAQVVEAYTARCCDRIAKMIDMTARKHPEAAEPLRMLADQVRLYSLVFGPGDVEHPAAHMMQDSASLLQPTGKIPRSPKVARIIELLQAGCSTEDIVADTQCSKADVHLTRHRYLKEAAP